MNIDFNGQNVIGNFTKRATIYNSAIDNSQVKFKPMDKVNDEARGYLYYKNQEWAFCGLSQLSVKAYENFVLLLESPHKDEFDSRGNPLRPANGITETKINNLLGKEITNHLIKNPSIHVLNQKTVYKVFLVNAIQYQTSCYNALNNQQGYKDNWRTIRNAVFKALWNDRTINLPSNLTNRIKNLKASIVVECITGGMNKNGQPCGLKKVVLNGLPTAITISFSLKHPSSW